MRGARISAAIAAVAVVAGASGEVSAIGALRYASPGADALGVGEGFRALLLDDAPRWWVEVGERDLYGVAELAVAQVQAGAAGDRAAALATAVALVSPVGREYHASLETIYRRSSSIAVSVGIEAWSLVFDGAAGARAAAVCAGASAPLFADVLAAYRVDGIGVAGFALRGADTSVMVVAAPHGPFTVVAGGRMGRDGERGLWVASRMRWRRRLEGIVGYDDTAAMLRVSCALRVGSLAVSVGASAHPVLGLSKSVSVRWAVR